MPQGSVLGPLLFSLFINDLSKCLCYCSHIFYADDSTIYLRFKPSDLGDAINKVNENLNLITTWCQQKSHKINILKTKAMFFGSARYINLIDTHVIPRIVIHEEPLEVVTSFNYLGVILDEKLTWQGHVNKTCSTV